MPRVASFFVWFAALELLWAVLVGTTQSTELLAGLAATAIGAAFVEALRSLGLFEYRVDRTLLLKASKLAWLAPFDFGLATWTLVRSLARGGRVRGRWVRVPFRTQRGRAGRWQRAFAVAASNGAANAIVVALGYASLYRGGLPKQVTDVLAAALSPLRALHSGHVGDYVAWLTFGTAAIGGVFALTLR